MVPAGKAVGCFVKDFPFGRGETGHATGVQFIQDGIDGLPQKLIIAQGRGNG